MKTKEPISVNGAQITTATVDIQVIRIGSKQMTLAVFRQLMRKDIFDLYGNLLAAPWGWVNYDRPESGGKPFVFAYEGALYRSNVDLEEHHKLAVKPDRDPNEEPSHYDGNQYIPRRTIWTPNGKWLLTTSTSDSLQYYYFRVGPFDSKLAAQKHLENRLESIAVLEAVPQLFIAV